MAGVRDTAQSFLPRRTHVGFGEEQRRRPLCLHKQKVFGLSGGGETLFSADHFIYRGTSVHDAEVGIRFAASDSAIAGPP